jgi:hypothetical protein
MSATCDSCGNDFPDRHPHFIVGVQVVCRRCHDELQPLCPHCRQILPRRPKAKSRCKACRNFIYVRTTQNRFDSTLLTESQVDELEAIEWLSQVGTDEASFDDMRTTLRSRFGAEPSVGDVIWGVLNSASARSSDPLRLAQLEVLKAERLVREGKDPDRKRLTEAIRHEKTQWLLQWKADGFVVGVTISGTPGRCRSCRQLPRTVIPIDDAIRLQLLPHLECTNEPDEHPRSIACRCEYQVEFG